MTEPIIYAFDAGSPRQGLAWARVAQDAVGVAFGGTDVSVAADAIARDIDRGSSVAMAFEAPLFLPVADDYRELCRARRGEGARPWSAGAGAYVTGVVIPLAAWVLRRVREKAAAASTVRFTLAAEDWPRANERTATPVLLAWEAFVSGEGHATSSNEHGMSEHVQDAATAALAFQSWALSPTRAGSAVEADPCISTIAAAALWAGWTTDVDLLHRQALVLWPRTCRGRDVRPWAAR